MDLDLPADKFVDWTKASEVDSDDDEEEDVVDEEDEVEDQEVPEQFRHLFEREPLSLDECLKGAGLEGSEPTFVEESEYPADFRAGT